MARVGNGCVVGCWLHRLGQLVTDRLTMPDQTSRVNPGSAAPGAIQKSINF